MLKQFYIINDSNYIETGRRRGMIAKERFRIGSNFYEKVKTSKYIGSLVTNKNSIQDEIKKQT